MLDEQAIKFLQNVHTGAIVTVRPNGSAHVARVTVGLVAGKVWSTGTQNRVRTKHVRTNPRATYFVFDQRGRRWIAIEGRITLHEGPDAPKKCLEFQRAVGRPPDDVDAYLREMVEVQRIVFEMDVERVYGAYTDAD